MRTTQKLSTTLFLLLLAFTSYGQDALSITNKTIEKIQKAKTISHHTVLSIDNEYATQGESTFKIVPQDTLLGAYYRLENKQYTILYNGLMNTTVNWKENTSSGINLLKYPEEINRVKSRMLYTFSAMDICNTLKEAKQQYPKRISLASDSIINGVSCKRLLVIQRDTIINGQKKYTQLVISIDRKTYLPVHCKSTNYSNNISQIIETTLSDYKINNPEINSDWFNTSGISNKVVHKEYIPEPRMKPVHSALAGKSAPDWTLPVVGGGTIQLSKLKGKIVLLEFGGVYCSPCRAAIPELNSILQTIDPKSFVLIGLYSDVSLEKLSDYKEKSKIEFPMAYDGDDNQKHIRTSYTIYGIPHFFLINQQGIIVKDWEGYAPEVINELKAEIQKLL